jgi:acyl-CoA reductase-like NAD-dependent aldehyde dehydrogenase
VAAVSLELRVHAVALLREALDLAVCQATEQATNRNAAKRSQEERDAIVNKFVEVMSKAAEEASR